MRFLAMIGAGSLDPSAPIVRADDNGLTRGDGCFEGCRVLTMADGTSRVDKPAAHLVRMARSAAALELPFDIDEWDAFVTSAVTAWHDPGEWAMKLVLTRGAGAGAPPTGFLTISDLPTNYARQRRDGLRVATLSRGTSADAFADAPWLLGGVKTLSYAVNMAAQREAARRGCDDAILVSVDGAVLESTVSSVVWSVGRRLHTTPIGATGILGGTTQQLLFDQASRAGWDCVSVPATVADLHAAEVLWLIGSVRGPVDVVELDGTARVRRPDLDAQIRSLAGFGPR
ncbi:MAG: 4-amino-4-deoxychorismate lyase [Pseudonocardiales bacterium]|nr:4-amino-4-deoxychorismate lyase [Pseudonocardiales bacterium]